MLITAQFSVYPLGTGNLGDYVYEAVNVVKSFGLDVDIGPASSVTYEKAKRSLRHLTK